MVFHFLELAFVPWRKAVTDRSDGRSHSLAAVCFGAATCRPETHNWSGSRPGVARRSGFDHAHGDSQAWTGLHSRSRYGRIAAFEGTVESLRSKGAGPQTLAAIEAFFPNPAPTDSKSSGPAAGVLPRNFPAPTGYVNDFAGVLSPDARTRLDRICSQLDRSQAAAQIAVVTIHTLDGADVADYAKELFNKWGIGHKGSNRGVLVLLAVNDRKYRITVGYGLENILADAKAAEIGRGAASLLHVNDYDRGVSSLVDQVAQVIADDAKVKLENAPGQLPQR